VDVVFDRLRPAAVRQVKANVDECRGNKAELLKKSEKSHVKAEKIKTQKRRHSRKNLLTQG